MNTNNIETYLQRGAHDKDWYRDTELLFRDLYGDDQLQLVTQLFAATSINSSLKSNIRLFRRAMKEIHNGEPIGPYLPVMKLQIERIRAGLPMSGRKIRSFAAAMSGDVSAVVVDIWLLRAFGEENRYERQRAGKTLVRASGATSFQYDVIEYYCRDLAARKSLEPRQVSAMIWSGVRKDRLTRYDLILRRQAYNMFDPHHLRM